MKKLTITQKITSRDTASLKNYLADISKYEPLSIDEEYEVAVKARTGDKVASHKLVLHNLKFVVSVAKQCMVSDVKLVDLINEGNLGLIIASLRFDPENGNKFISYAVWWVRRKIYEFITNNSRTVRLPGNKYTDISKVKKATAYLEQHLERPPSSEEIYDYMTNNMKIGDIENVLALDAVTTSSLDMKMDEDGFTLKDVLPNDSCQPADHHTAKEDKDKYIEMLLGELPKKERLVVESLFGFNNASPMTLNEVGLRMNLSRERVRQIKESALRILRSKVKNLDLYYMMEK